MTTKQQSSAEYQRRPIAPQEVVIERLTERGILPSAWEPVERFYRRVAAELGSRVVSTTAMLDVIDKTGAAIFGNPMHGARSEEAAMLAATVEQDQGALISALTLETPEA